MKVSVEDFNISLSELSLPDIVTSDASMSFNEASKLMMEKKIGSLILKSSSGEYGIFTERDALTKSHLINSNPEISLEDLMTKNPICLNENDQLVNAMALMTSKEIRHVPIVNDHEEIIKMISIKDILGFISNLFSEFVKEFPVITDWKKEDVNIQEKAILYHYEKVKGELSSEIFHVTLKKAMSTRLLRTSRKARIGDVLEQMRLDRVSFGVVLDYETEIVGVITERDFLFKVYAGDFSLDDSVEKIMTSDPHILAKYHQFGNALSNMFKFRYRNIPIVDEQAYPVGVVSLLDLLIFISDSLGIRNVLKFS